MSPNLDDDEDEVSHALWESEIKLNALLKKRRAAEGKSLSAYREIGQELLDVKSKGLVAHGEFDTWCHSKLGLGKSQRSDYMALAKAWDRLPETRSWAIEQGHEDRYETLSEIMKLLRLQKRAETGHVTSKRASREQRILTQITEAEKALVPKVFALWEDARAEKGVANAAEFRLLRWAARRCVSLQDYLGAFNLKVPAHRNFDENDKVSVDADPVRGFRAA